MDYLKRNSTTMTIASYYELHQLKKVDYNPSCQRKSVWGPDEKAFLIDTILKNFPIPPIFLHQGIEVENGTTKFSVIDGKQRLLAIISFIEGKINIPDSFSEGAFGDEKLNGLLFQELKDDAELIEYRKLFWRYQLPIEYIDTEDNKVVDNIFDRLNRNGIPLKEQELRKAKYNSEKLYQFIEKLSEIEYWNSMLSEVVDTSRMLDVEFISELLFVILEDDILDSDQKILDSIYENYVSKFEEYNEEIISSMYTSFMDITKIFVGFNLDLDTYKINKVSHIYALWTIAYYVYKGQFKYSNINESLQLFYYELRNNKNKDGVFAEYRKSMSSNTKSKYQRKKRVDALLKFIEENKQESL